jgi:hypothetical protein
MIYSLWVVEASMVGTYSQIYIQIVFAVQGRQNLLQKEWRDEVFKYMSGIIKNKDKSLLSSMVFPIMYMRLLA